MTTKIFYDFEATSVSRDADMISVGLVAVTETNTYKQSGKYPDDRYDENVPGIKSFYAEFQDFNIDKCDNWVKENIVGKLTIENYISVNEMVLNNETGNVRYKGDKDVISFYLKQWLSQFEEIEFWADFDVIDKPMLIDLIADWKYQDCYSEMSNFKPDYKTGGIIKTKQYKVGLPKHLPNVQYDQFFDLHTLFKIKGIDTDISREEYSEIKKQVIPLPFSDYDKSHNALYDAYVNWKVYEKLNN